SMAAFSHFDEQSLWDLAFYIKSLRFQNLRKDSIQLRQIFDKLYRKIDLKTIAVSSDQLLKDTLSSFTNSPGKAVAAFRLLHPLKENLASSLDLAIEQLELVLKTYKKGQRKEARSHALDAYLEGIEPVEAQ